VTCSVSGQILVKGRQISNAHNSGPRKALLAARLTACQGTNIAGTKHDWSIDDGDIIAMFPLAGTTCDGLTALKLGHGAVLTHERLSARPWVLGHTISTGVANVTSVGTATGTGSAMTLALPVRSRDFDNETATLAFDQSSLVSHCGAHQPNTIDYTATFTIA